MWLHVVAALPWATCGGRGWKQRGLRFGLSPGAAQRAGGGFRNRVVEGSVQGGKKGKGGPEVPFFCILKVLEGAAAHTEGHVFPPPLPADETVRDAWAPSASRNPPGRWHCGAAALWGPKGPAGRAVEGSSPREPAMRRPGSEDGPVCSPSPPAPGLCVPSSQCLRRATSLPAVGTGFLPFDELFLKREGAGKAGAFQLRLSSDAVGVFLFLL